MINKLNKKLQVSLISEQFFKNKIPASYRVLRGLSVIVDLKGRMAESEQRGIYNACPGIQDRKAGVILRPLDVWVTLNNVLFFNLFHDLDT